ncbi:MAG: phosphoenolpyruvate carboxylase [Actinobacteria bacterium]|nr:phosphoenolpyruvate carboxylase [Actinomycetota bacterium]
MDLPRIPATMMTQHPDSASRYVSIQEEPQEAVEALLPPPDGLGLEEVMIDFEGKLTPYQQTSQIVVDLAAHALAAGRDVLVTPRIPSGEEEGVFRQLMALMSVVESNYRAFKRNGLYAVREVILPMTRSSEELISVRERVNDVIALAHKEFGLSPDPSIIMLIPLFETAPQILGVYDELKAYIAASTELGVKPARIRYMLGLSDMALSYGLVPATMAVKLGIADGYELSSRDGIEVAPILGGGTLPFRGRLSLENLDNTMVDYSGVRTVTIQSAMRYDRGAEETRRLAAELKKRLSTLKPLAVHSRQFYLDVIGVFSKHYLQTFYRLTDVASRLSDIIPRQRDRLARKGESGYARDLPRPAIMADLVSQPDLAAELRGIAVPESAELPRAISYAAALYSIGLPPEIIGTGRGVDELVERFGEESLKSLVAEYRGLKDSLTFALRFVRLETAADFIPEEVLFEVEEDLRLIGEHLGITPGVEKKEDRLYHTILETMRPMLKEISGIGTAEQLITDESVEGKLVRDWIVRLGSIRGGLG